MSEVLTPYGHRLVEEDAVKRELLRQRGYCLCKKIESGYVVDELQFLCCGDCGGRLRFSLEEAE